jgi:DNA-binding NarL/FixJ family response regulator
VIRVLVVDDQAMVRAGFAALLAAQSDIEVVGDASNGVEAVARSRTLHPDVVLMDVRMPEMDGLEAARQLLDPPRGVSHRPKVLMLTTFDVDDYVYEALRAGASGFLLKDAPPADLVSAVRVVAAGEALLAPSVTKRLIEEFARARPAVRRRSTALNALTARESEVLTLIARGLSNTEIAAELVVAEQTVKTHIGRIFTKLDLRDRAQAVVFAYESGLVAAGSG